jgi:hypothetical protein
MSEIWQCGNNHAVIDDSFINKTEISNYVISE